MNHLRFIFFIALFFSTDLLFGQKKECQGQLSLAEDFYTGGDFEEATRLLEQYQECSGVKNSNYFKLRAEILLAQDQRQEAKKEIARYINSKGGNYISEEDPQLFKDIFYEVRDSLSARVVTSVSKKPEDVDLAAATVILIKESEFATRGYLDIVDLLADQPGFDISRIYGLTYANVYQRGFRQENTERTLLMIDGIEENDVWSNIAYLSRQYPLSNISAVEIVYGPASTIYGARAFAGAINIITKKPAAMLKKTDGSGKASGSDFAASAKVVGGSYNTKSAELNLSGKNKEVSVLLTGRIFSTDGRDLSGTSFYNYNPSDLDALYYDPVKLKALSYKDNPLTTANELDATVTRLGLTPGSQYYNYFTGYGTGTLTINPDSTDAIISRVRKIDKENYLMKVNGAPVGYSNNSHSYYIGGKLNVPNFEVGFRSWKSQEGFNFYQDLFGAGSKNGSKWTPINTTFYSIYDREFRDFSFTNTSSYVTHGLDKTSDFVSYTSFYGSLSNNPYTNLTLFNLLFPDSVIDGRKQGWQNNYFYYKARQFRNDFKVNYTHNRLNMLSGIDIRGSQLQGDYLQYKSFAGPEQEDQSHVHFAEELGTVANQDKGGNQYNSIDAGFYTQATYKAIDSVLFITAGGRFDYNRIRSEGGFGSVFNPKVAAVFMVNKLVLKAIYSRGIQNVPQFTKFSTGTLRTPNPNISPEKIQNFEIVIQNRQTANINWDAACFYALIKDAVASVVDPSDPKKIRNQNAGTYQIAGIQANIRYVPAKKPFGFYFNTTYTLPKEIDDKSESNFETKTIGDIAPLKANFIINYHTVLKRNDLNINLRSNYVASKPVGPATTVKSNEGVNASNAIPSYIVFFTTLQYRNTKFDALTLQFTINNLLNSIYYSPGPRTANGNSTDNYNGYVSYVPQQTRNYLLTLIFKL